MIADELSVFQQAEWLRLSSFENDCTEWREHYDSTPVYPGFKNLQKIVTRKRRATKKILFLSASNLFRGCGTNHKTWETDCFHDPEKEKKNSFEVLGFMHGLNELKGLSK